MNLSPEEIKQGNSIYKNINIDQTQTVIECLKLYPETMPYIEHSLNVFIKRGYRFAYNLTELENFIKLQKFLRNNE